MSSTTAAVGAGAPAGARRQVARPGLVAYFASDRVRIAQTALGLIWLLDGGLQFQSFMYSKGFIQMLTGMTAGQPGWVADSVNWGAHLAQHNLAVYNTLFALVQVAIGLGLLYRPAVKSALALSFAWALVVWWFGEAFGMLFMTMAQPLTGAPGAVLLYGLIGLMVWPSERPGGLLGVRGCRTIWAVMWLLMAWLWLESPSSSANAVYNSINAAPSGMSWLSSTQDGFASVAKGNGLVISLVFAALSGAIGIAVAANWRAKQFLWLAVAVGLLYWVVGQGFGGIFEGGATDPNSGILWVLMAYVLYTLVDVTEPVSVPSRARRRREVANAST